jgi:RNA polymerase sigma-70 factor (ECF subfamily)
MLNYCIGTSSRTMKTIDSFTGALTTMLPELKAFAHSLCSNTPVSDDLVQETLLRAWSARAQFSEGTNFRAWLFTILRHCYYSEYRRFRREVEDPDGIYAASIAKSPEHDAALQIRDLCRALKKIPLDQRAAVVLVCANGYSCEEAAEICGCRIGTIKSRISRGRERLAEILGDEMAFLKAPSDDYMPAAAQTTYLTAANLTATRYEGEMG